MDRQDFEPLFREVTKGATKFTRRMAIEMADFFGLKPMSLVWKLEKCGLLRRGSWDWFRINGGITKDHIEQVRSEAAEQKRKLEVR